MNRIYSKVSYHYVDSDNYKAFYDIFISGAFNIDQILSVEDALSVDRGFIPEQVGMAPLQSFLITYDKEPSVADHCWHYLGAIEKIDVLPASEPIWGDVELFCSTFSAVKNWDVSLSSYS